jgi:hypothetical protein
MTTKIDLDELARKACAATPGPWRVSGGVSKNKHPEYLAVLYDDNTGDSYEVCDECTTENAWHVAANSPPVTLALVARIRKLEATCRCAAVALRMHNEESPTAKESDRIVEEGTVLP